MTLSACRLGGVLVATWVILVAGCGSGGDPRQEAGSSDERFVAEVGFPIAAPQLVATAPEGTSDAEVRQLAAALADLDGVAVTEADYTARTVGVVFEDGLDPTGRAELVERIRAVPGVAGVVTR